LINEQPRNLSVSRAFLLGGCPNYSHWLLDYLPRLQLCHDFSLPVLINKPLAPFQSESLHCLGVNDSRLLPLDYPASCAVRHLFYPSICSSSTTPPLSFQPAVLDWLHKAFAPLITSRRPDRKIFISRAEEIQRRRRRLLNHEEIVSIAQGYGFEIIALEKLSFVEQVQLFAQAAVIAGAHGAGFTNMVFARKGTELVELIGPQFSRSEWSWTYVRLAKLLQQRLRRIVGRANEQDSIEFNHLPYETYTIDPEEFERLLRD
jgi:capsular polysaccharide biosynthesis protein